MRWTHVAGLGIAILGPGTAAHAGGRGPMYITTIHGRVEVREARPGARWHRAQTGALMGGAFLLRTGRHSYAHLDEDLRCVDSNSLIRINDDTEASLTVLRGRISAVDGKRGPNLPDRP